LRGWPEIRAGRDVLISAPTGSGKTLAAFLLCIDGLVRRARLGPLPRPDRSGSTSRPLKALSNDVHRTWRRPLAEISALAAKRGIPLAAHSAPPLRTAIRRQWERQRMNRERPHILVTTPESLFIPAHGGQAARDAGAHAHRDRGTRSTRVAGTDKRGLAPGRSRWRGSDPALVEAEMAGAKPAARGAFPPR